jgi:hypothetical protein
MLRGSGKFKRTGGELENSGEGGRLLCPAARP